MLIRMARQEEIPFILEQGYLEWHKNRTFEKYCTDNLKEDAFGTRYVLEINDEIVSSLILLKLEKINGHIVYGIGSIVTHQNHRSKGYANILIKSCIEIVDEPSTIIFLYSDINPSFYEKFNFRILPIGLQKCKSSTMMSHCSKDVWNELLNVHVDLIPEYF